MITTEDSDVLELPDNNLFINGVILDFGGDEKILTREPIEIKGSQNDRYHLVKYRDTLNRLAWEYYQELQEDTSKLWWVIADANNIFNPLDISEYIGKEIIIPDLIRLRMEL